MAEEIAKAILTRLCDGTAPDDPAEWWLNDREVGDDYARIVDIIKGILVGVGAPDGR